MRTTTMTVGDLARTTPCATRVFMRRHLDFCCGGGRTLAEACAKAGLDAASVLAEIEAEVDRTGPQPTWDTRPLPDLCDHIESHYHAALRRDLPPLVEAARRVERVHAEHPDVRAGLADLLEEFAAAIENHMRKEELVLFPLIRRGTPPPGIAMPISAMQHEHDLHGAELAGIRALTSRFTLPPGACATWTALYTGLAALERELMEHIALENNVLFPRAQSKRSA